MNDIKIKHLEFIQNVITRMAQNSFLLKGWTVTIVAALFVFANTKEMDSNYLLIAYVPIIFFWLLDGYYLHQERQFRSFYDIVRKKKDEEIDFSMDTSEINEGDWINLCFSTTLLLFYSPIAAVILLMIFVFGV